VSALPGARFGFTPKFQHPELANETVGTYISYVISVYDASISAHKFTTLVPNLVRVLGFGLGTTLVAQWVMMHIASLKVIFRGRTNLVPENLYK
jgi:hypothetical protein